MLETAIILAGGKSSRMGFDKINIPYKGGRLLDNQVKELKKYFTEIIIVSNTLTNYHDDQVKVICDEYKNIGPLAGLHVGLKHASSFYSYVLACDMPFIKEDYIKKIKNEINDKDAYVASINGMIEPFHAVYKKEVYKKVEDFVSKEKHYGCHAFIKQLDYKIIEIKIDKEMFYNANTIKDLEKLM